MRPDNGAMLAADPPIRAVSNGGEVEPQNGSGKAAAGGGSGGNSGDADGGGGTPNAAQDVTLGPLSIRLDEPRDERRGAAGCET